LIYEDVGGGRIITKERGDSDGEETVVEMKMIVRKKEN